jgi:hypothetical protein
MDWLDLNSIKNIWLSLKERIAQKASSIVNEMQIWKELDHLVDVAEFIEHCIKCCNSFIRKRLE